MAGGGDARDYLDLSLAVVLLKVQRVVLVISVRFTIRLLTTDGQIRSQQQGLQSRSQLGRKRVIVNSGA